MGPYKGRTYAFTVPWYGRCVEPEDPFSSLDFLHGWWSEMPIPLNERNNERACRRGDVREWEGPQTCPAHMGPDTRLSDPHGATTRRAFRTGTRSGAWNSGLSPLCAPRSCAMRYVAFCVFTLLIRSIWTLDYFSYNSVARLRIERD